MLSSQDLATLAEAGTPESESSAGAFYLRDVYDGVMADLAEVGAGLHLSCLRLAADLAVPTDDVEAFAAFLDLNLWNEGLSTTTGALEAAGQRLGLALLDLLVQLSALKSGNGGASGNGSA